MEIIDFLHRIKLSYASSSQTPILQMCRLCHRHRHESEYWATMVQPLNKKVFASTIQISQWQFSSCIILHLNATQMMLCMDMNASTNVCVWLEMGLCTCECGSNFGHVFQFSLHQIFHRCLPHSRLCSSRPVIGKWFSHCHWWRWCCWHFSFHRIRTFSLTLFNLPWQTSKLNVIIDRGGASALRKYKAALCICWLCHWFSLFAFERK